MEEKGLINSLRNHNNLQKYTEEFKEIFAKLRQTYAPENDSNDVINFDHLNSRNEENACFQIKMENEENDKEIKSNIKQEITDSLSEQEGSDDEGMEPSIEFKIPDSVIFSGYQNEQDKATTIQKQMEVLVDFYKGIAKEQRDKFQLAEEKLQTEIEMLKQQLKEIQGRKIFEDERNFTRIRELEMKLHYEENKNSSFNRDPRAYYVNPFEESHEKGLLLNEIKTIKRALEHMEIRNFNLVKELQIKEDANFRLKLEKKKSGQMQKILCDEKHLLKKQVANRDVQIKAMHLIMKALCDNINSLQKGKRRVDIPNTFPQSSKKSTAVEVNAVNTVLEGNYSQCSQLPCQSLSLPRTEQPSAQSRKRAGESRRRRARRQRRNQKISRSE